MEKAHSRIKWENYPSIATPLNETNLNKMDVALDEVDNRVLGLDTAKLDKAIANTMIKDISFAEDTGIFTITLLDGTTKTIDTKLEKIATNFSYDYETQKLILTLSDGTQQEIDLSSLISHFEFVDSDTIDFTVDSEGNISAVVRDGSITEGKLQPNFLADVKIEVAKAKSSSDSSYENATTARESATAAEQFRNEAEQFRNQAEAMSGINIATTEIAGIVKPDGTTIRVDPDGTIHADSGTVNYNDLENKPKINGVEITGELTTEDLNIDLGTGDYEELENKPSINGTELSGNKTLDDLGIASAKKVEEIETELQETTSKVNIIIENADLGFKETASGENIHLDDSADSKLVEFAMYGKATQEGTPTPDNPIEIEVAGESYNLIPYPYAETTHTESGIVWTANSDGTIIANGSSQSNFSDFAVISHLSPITFEAGEYILTGCPKGGVLNTTYEILLGTVSSGTTSRIAWDVGSGAKFTLENDTPIWVTIRVEKGNTVNNLIFKPMLRKSSVKNDRYMPFGVGSVEVKNIGKNLLPYPHYQTTQVQNEVSFTDNGDGTMKVNGTANADCFLVLRGRTETNEALWVEAGTYTFSGCPSGGTNSTYYIWVGKVGSDNSATFIGGDYGNGFTYTFEERTKLHVQIRVMKDVAVNNIVFKPMLRLASDTDSTYEPYKEILYTIPTPNGLAGIPVNSGGNYTDENGKQWICDEIVKNVDGSGNHIQRIGKAVFDGSEDEAWNTNVVDNINRFFIKVSDAKNESARNFVVCSHGIFTTEHFSGASFISSQHFYLYNGLCASVEEFKTWLSTNNVTVCYELATPITTPLTPEQITEIEKLKTFYPITNISNDFDCGMKVKYIVDAKNYIDNRLAMLTNAIINNI